MSTVILTLTLFLGQADTQPLAWDNERLELVRQRLQDRWKKSRAFLSVDGRRQEVARYERPLHTFFEPSSDGGRLASVWVWGAKGRPVAVFVQALNPNTRRWGHELVAIANGVSAKMHDGWTWTPDKGLKMTPFKEAPAPAESDVGRLVQMKTLGRRITMTATYGGENFAMRMLPRPIHRYNERESGLIDGALFNFAPGTGPEALLAIECRKSAAAVKWSYGILPLAGAAVTAKLDDEIVWSKGRTTSSRAQEFYSVWLEDDKP